MNKIARLVRPAGQQNSFRRRHGTALLRSAAALLALATLAAPASAKPFQQYLNGVCGASAKICKIDFFTVPAGSRLDVKNVSCYIRLALESGRGTQIRASQLLVLGANPVNVVNAVTLVPVLVGQPATDDVYSASHPISAFAGAQQRFQAYVELDAGTFSQVACHISGDLVKA